MRIAAGRLAVLPPADGQQVPPIPKPATKVEAAKRVLGDMPE